VSSPRRKGRPGPIDEYQELLPLIREGKLPKLVLFLTPNFGEEETWFSDQLMRAAREWALQQDGLDLMDVDGHSPDFSADSMDAFLGSQSLFAGRQALIFSRATAALKKYKRLAKALLQAVEKEGGPEWIMLHAEGKQASALVKELVASKSAKVIRFRRLFVDPPPWNPAAVDQSEAAKFAIAHANGLGMRLQNGAAGLLVEMSGGRPADLMQSLQHFQLLNQLQVSVEDVREVTAHSAEGSARDYADALLTGDSARALQLLAKVRARGLHSWDGRRISPRDSFTMLISTAIRERRQTAVIRAAVDGGATLEEALKGSGAKPSMPVTKRMERRLALCPSSQLEAVLHGLRRAEHRLKTGAWRDSLRVLEQLAFESYRKSAPPQTRGRRS